MGEVEWSAGGTGSRGCEGPGVGCQMLLFSVMINNIPVEWVSMEVDTHKEAIQLELIHDPRELPSA